MPPLEPLLGRAGGNLYPVFNGKRYKDCRQLGPDPSTLNPTNLQPSTLRSKSCSQSYPTSSQKLTSCPKRHPKVKILIPTLAQKSQKVKSWSKCSPKGSKKSDIPHQGSALVPQSKLKAPKNSQKLKIWSKYSPKGPRNLKLAPENDPKAPQG